MDELKLMEGEQEKDYLLRLGKIKEEGEVRMTWGDLSRLLNMAFDRKWTDSAWRKKYRRYIAETHEEKVLKSDERIAEGRCARSLARSKEFADMLLEAVKKAEPLECDRTAIATDKFPTDRTMIAMLSDIHYGLTFEGRFNKYDSQIAARRVMDYADELIRIASSQDIHNIYVVLMGDMISGAIHKTIRLENREDIVDQLIGVSELVAAFLIQLSRYFSGVTVYSVPGNHSRIDPDTSAILRTERLDNIVTWYCKGRLSLFDNVVFQSCMIDQTIADFTLYGKHYVCVHGDLDPDLHTSVNRIGQAFGIDIDYILAGHLHVPECRIEDKGFIRNGSVCGSGDDYTVKKRLFSPASQVALVVSDRGVESINPIILT